MSAGWDGNIWYTENDTNHVGSIDLNGTILPKYDTGLRPLSITPGPDGNMWFTIADGNAIGRVNIATPGNGYVLSMDGGFSPKRRKVPIGTTVKWMFVGPNTHSVVGHEPAASSTPARSRWSRTSTTPSPRRARTTYATGCRRGTLNRRDQRPRAPAPRAADRERALPGDLGHEGARR